MKFFTVSTIFVLLPLLAQQVLAVPQGGGRHGGHRGGQGGASSSAAAPAATTSAAAQGGAVTTTSAAAATTTSSAAAAASSAAGGNNANNGDPQTSLTLDPAVLATGFENDGQSVPEAGQVASKTSSNNFINFCLTVPNLPITNGAQVQGGSCNPAPMGIIASTNNMPSSKFTNPKNLDTIPANTAFTVSMAIQNLNTGNFVNAAQNYFAAPQFTDGSGDVSGHSHVVIELIDALDSTTPTNPQKFAFFKGLNAPATNGILTAAVTAGLPAGVYRMASINTAANHQPVLVAIAQHGALDDMIYFTVTANGQPAANSNAATPPASASSSVAAASKAATTTTSAVATTSSSKAAAAATSSAAAGGKKGGKKGGRRFLKDY
ncbi:hypothetical protein JAAARDRAFT_355536 [Jaapia argillacea MUCL 33604]|uniref:Glycoside hydrolase family 61 protein n=1 Tax=Jaapia argillacea MUCL 33604 TaxID=933084 RepID=A0A067PJL2_9AGAM|nr:hypothetical protein JAAARDRAFT_355536 [Jaapia argillacea MUCL 33604]